MSHNPPRVALRTTLHYGLIALLLPVLLAAQTTPPAPKKAGDPPATEIPLKLEPFEVTGSHVKRLDTETPQPVIVYSAAAIEDSGYNGLGEFIQSLAVNNAQVNTESTGASFIPGATTANPRGLGSNRFLTLVNGRRTVPYALTNGISGTRASSFNFSSIPFAAIDRLEFLKDGASAIYGSDAITGVYNIILKKEYAGTTVDFSISNTFKHDSLFRRASVTTGFGKAGWQITAAASHQVGHSNFIHDFGITTTDYRYLGAKGQRIFSIINVPSPVILTPAQSAATGMGGGGGYYIIPGGVPTANPTKASFVYVGPSSAAIPTENIYDFANDTQFKPASEAHHGYVNLHRDLTPTISAFAQAIYSRSKSYYEFAPTGFTTTLNGYTLAADNPYNPFGIPLTNTGTTWFYSFSSRGFRPKREVSDTMTALSAGLRGTVLGTWGWETGISYGRDNTIIRHDHIPPEKMRAALAGTTRTTAFNPFGPSDNPNLVASLYTRSVDNDSFVDSLSYNLSTSAKPWQIPLPSAGQLGVAAGYEYRKDYLRGRTNQDIYIGLSNNEPFNGQRQTHAVYVEFSLPLQKWLEVQVAGRHEEYSDEPDTTKPKYGVKLRLPSTRFVNVLARASYSESFKAPDLGQSYQRQGLASTSITDPLRPQDGVRTVTVVQGGNPSLLPEEGKVQYAGFVFEIPAVRGLSFSADYFDIKINNVIGRLSIGYLLSPEGLALYPNAVVRNNTVQNPGPIVRFSGIPENLGFQLFRGWDFGARYNFRTQRFGAFNFRADATQTLKRGSDAGLGGGFANQTGRYNAPVWRGNLGAGWRYKALSVFVGADIIGQHYNRNFTTAGWGENVFTLINPSITYRSAKKVTLTVGLSNVFNHRPPQVGFDPLGFDERSITAAGINGRMYNLRLRKEF